MTACGLDFGTSNSAIGVVRDGVAVLAPVEGDKTLLPSAVFFSKCGDGCTRRWHGFPAPPPSTA